MAKSLVSRSDEKLAPNLFAYALPALCDRLDALSAEKSWLRVVLKGTNFFAPLVLNTGSHMKTNLTPLLGRFPIGFVSEILHKHFEIKSVSKAELDQTLIFVCANRRVTEEFILTLQSHLRSVTEQGAVPPTIELAARSAYDTKIDTALGQNRRVAVKALALLTFPEVLCGSQAQQYWRPSC
jgi:hypothetical protein